MPLSSTQYMTTLHRHSTCLNIVVWCAGLVKELWSLLGSGYEEGPCSHTTLSDLFNRHMFTSWGTNLTVHVPMRVHAPYHCLSSGLCRCCEPHPHLNLWRQTARIELHPTMSTACRQTDNFNSATGSKSMHDQVQLHFSPCKTTSLAPLSQKPGWDMGTSPAAKRPKFKAVLP
jgi:hypothetical protein